MWIFILIALLVAAYLVYIYGVFTPLKLYTADLNRPTFLYYSFKGSKNDLAQ